MVSNPQKIDSTLKYDFFPGCVIQNRIPFIEKSARFVFEKLGVSLFDEPFGCCPDPVGIQSTDRQSWLTLGARNLVLSEKNHHSIMSMCNGCAETLKSVNHELNKNLKEKELINSRLEKIGKKFTGTSSVKHFVEILFQDVGVDQIKKQVVKPLTGIKVAIHVGCHYARPSEIMQCDDPLNSQFQQKILEALGLTVVEYDEPNLCCGSSVDRNNTEVALGLLKRKFNSISTAGSPIDMIVVNCPSCFQQFELGQRNLKKQFNMDLQYPILYITELMALAFGASMNEIGLKFHTIKPMKLLKEHGIE